MLRKELGQQLSTKRYGNMMINFSTTQYCYTMYNMAVVSVVKLCVTHLGWNMGEVLWLWPGSLMGLPGVEALSLTHRL